MRSTRAAEAVAELGSLIWLEFVKQAVTLRSEKVHFFSVGITAALLSQRQEHLIPAVINAEMRESTRPEKDEVINSSRSDAALGLILGTRIGLVTALNDHRGSRLTGSLPLVQQSLAGVVMIGVGLI